MIFLMARARAGDSLNVEQSANWMGSTIIAIMAVDFCISSHLNANASSDFSVNYNFFSSIIINYVKLTIMTHGYDDRGFVIYVCRFPL